MCYRSEILKKTPLRDFARKLKLHLVSLFRGPGEGFGQGAALKRMHGQNLECSGFSFCDINKATWPAYPGSCGFCCALNCLSLMPVSLPCNDFLLDLGLLQRVRSQWNCPTRTSGAPSEPPNSCRLSGHHTMKRWKTRSAFVNWDAWVAAIWDQSPV